MSLDALTNRIAELLESGSIPSSRLSRPMRERLAALFHVGALSDVKAGGGRRVTVTDPEAVRRWVNSAYPSGLAGTERDLPPRAESVANFADSKRGRPIGVRLVYMRGFGTTALNRSSGTMPLASLTRDFGVAAAIIDPADPWRMDGVLALVENLESFLHTEHVVSGVDAALWYQGRIAERLVDWLVAMPDLRMLHMPDYDPVGLGTYLRIRARVGDRVRLFVPDDLEVRVARFGKAVLLSDSIAELSRVRTDADPAVRGVLEVIDRHGKGLEQEALLIPLDGS